jgi:uncharacterized protein
MKLLLFLVLLISSHVVSSQGKGTHKGEIKKWQKELNAEYRDPAASPLEPGALKKFKGHSFFNIDPKYRVIAKMILQPGSEFQPIKTSTPRFADHRVYAMLEFELDGQKFSMPVYQSKDLLNNPVYKDYLFFPFTDLTNNEETYGGGRYIDLRIPKEGSEIVVDFNKAYNPYCAYSNRYSCPIVPSENHLNMAVKAGVKLSQ